MLTMRFLFCSILFVLFVFSCTPKNNSNQSATSDIKDDTASFSHEEYCSVEIEHHFDYNNDGTNDSVCNETYVNLLRVLTTDTTVTKRINNAIRENLEQYLSEATEKCTKPERCNGFEFKRSTEAWCKVITNSGNILCIEFHSEDYDNLGEGSNNDPGRWHQNFDLKTGNIIDLDDFLLPNSIEKLTAIVKQEFISSNDGREWDFMENPNKKFELETYAIKTEGLLFTYNREDMGINALGIPNDVLIPYSKIQNLIDPNGLLGNFK